MSTKNRSTRRGSVYHRKSDGKWVAVIDLTVEGGPRRRLVRYASSAAEADRKLRDELRKIEAGIRSAGRQVTVGAFLGRWLESIRPPHGVRPSTHRRYSELVNVHLIPGLGKLRLVALQPTDVDAFLAAKLDSGPAPRTVHHMRAVLRAALTQAVRDGLIVRNPAGLSRPVRVEHREMTVLSPEQARAFLDAAKGDRLEALYATALAIGLRQGEALGLRWQDVNLEVGTLRVEHGLQRIAGKVQLIPTKSARSRRTVVMPGMVADALREHRTRQLEDRLLAGGRWHDGGFVFTSSIGTPVDTSELRRAFHAVLRRAGLPAIRWHDLRHSAASLMLVQGVSPRVVMETLGHSSIALTMNTYSHVLPALQREAADAIDRLLGEPR
ncbi:MAG TPA: site-specific integrase [Candidatus Saccharimonadales bacterium]|nr:site-specific integrase [Candidatus Saccharimonadales bacterium]HVC42365.1 site-specific integrase [Candidatus Saccharimonadales bacterium]